MSQHVSVGLRSRYFRRVNRTAWVLGIALLMALAQTGCREKRSSCEVVKISIPQLDTRGGTVTPVSRVSGRASQALIFPQGDVRLAEEYARWFRSNGWTRASHRQDVNSLEYIFTKDDAIMTLRFLAGQGITIEGSRPVSGMEAPVTP
jgi:hypothetical protein